jgi:nucleoside-diphosphate-sugar epimerase
MRVLIPGGAGFLGAALARHWAAHGHEVHVVARPKSDLWRLGDAATIGIHLVDVLEFPALVSLIRAVAPNLVVNAAARRGHPRPGVDRIAAWRANALTAVALLEALRESPPDRLVHVGSSLEYAPNAGPLHESDPLLPGTAWGAAKAAATLAVRQWSMETGVPTTIVRPFYVYGPTEPAGGLVADLMAALRDHRVFRIADGDSQRDFVYIDDMVAGVRLAAETRAAAGRAFNLGTGVGTTTEELIGLAERVSGRTLGVSRGTGPVREVERFHRVADVTAAAKILGWEATVTIEEGIRRLWETAPADERR